jgi:hypothetical protein
MYNVRVFPCNDSDFANSELVAGLDWVTGNQVKPAVANIDVLVPGGSTSIDKAVRRCIASGVMVVIAAGNQGADILTSPPPPVYSPLSPADVSQAITVAATDVNDNWASFSNHGFPVAILAPGVAITSDSATGDTVTVTEDGTSFAAPHVAGAIARYLQTNPTACNCTVKQEIVAQASPNKINNIPPAHSPQHPADTATPNLLVFTPSAWDAPTYYSLSLDGATGYVDVPDGGQGVSLNITGAITVEAWINTNTPMSHQGIIERYNNSAGMGTNDGGYALRIINNGKVRFFTLQNGVQFDSITSNSTLATLRAGWHHVAGVFDGSQMRIYIDGKLDNSKSSTFAPVTGTTDVKIGVQADGTGFFNELIDEVRVTGAAVYTGLSFPLVRHVTGVAGTVGLWRFDNLTAFNNGIAEDCALVNNGTLVGGATYSTNVP